MLTFPADARVFVDVHALDDCGLGEANLPAHGLHAVAIGVAAEDGVQQVQSVADLHAPITIWLLDIAPTYL